MSCIFLSLVQLCDFRGFLKESSEIRETGEKVEMAHKCVKLNLSALLIQELETASLDFLLDLDVLV